MAFDHIPFTPARAFAGVYSQAVLHSELIRQTVIARCEDLAQGPRP